MKNMLVLVSIILLISVVSCGPSVKEKVKKQQEIDSIAKVEKKKVIDSIRKAENITSQPKQGMQKSEKQQADQKYRQQQESKAKQNLHVDKSGGIHFGQPGN